MFIQHSTQNLCLDKLEDLRKISNLYSVNAFQKYSDVGFLFYLIYS